MGFPDGVATTTLVGQYKNALGDPVDGYLQFRPTATLKHLASNTVFTAEGWNVQLKGDGSFSIELPVNQPDLIPNAFLYHVTEVFQDTVAREWNIQLDQAMGALVQLAALSPAVPPSLGTTFPTLAEVASVAASLDQDLYEQLAGVQADINNLFTANQQVLDNDSLGVDVPPLVLGKIPAQYLPAIPQGNFYPVATQAAMLALNAVRGDYALRSDVSKTFVLSQDDPTVLANWLELPSGGAVASVNGKTGTVTLSYLDVNAAASTHTHTTLSMSSLNTVNATINVLSSASSTFGGVTTLKMTVDTTGAKLYDSSGVLWNNLAHSTRTQTLTNGASKWVPAAQTAGGMTVEVPTVTTNTATNWSTVSIVQVRDPRAASNGASRTWNVTYDSTTSTYTGITMLQETQSVVVSAVNKKTQIKQTIDSLQLNLNGDNPASITLDNLTQASGSFKVNANEAIFNVANFTLPASSAVIGDSTSTSQKVLFVRMKNATNNLAYERRTYIEQSSSPALVDALYEAGTRVSQLRVPMTGGPSYLDNTGTTYPLLLHTDTGLQTSTSGFVATTNIVLDSVAWRIVDGWAFLRISFHNNVALTAGNIANLPLLSTMPVANRPVLTYQPIITGAAGPLMSGYVDTNGTATMTATGSAIPINSSLSLQGWYRVV